jgi:hypothetical protein
LDFCRCKAGRALNLQQQEEEEEEEEEEEQQQHWRISSKALKVWN